MLVSLFAELLLPPTLLIVVMVIAIIIRQKLPRTSLSLLIGSVFSFYVLSIPIMTSVLMAPLQIYPPLTEQQISSDKSEAIVVLGAGRLESAPEFNNADTVPALGLQRLRYAAWLKRRTHLPLIVSGGKLQKEFLLSEAQLMRDVLQKEFLVEVNFMEKNSLNTHQNALFTANLLKNIGVTDIFLVSNAWHLRRAVEAFEQQGINVLPAPTAYYGSGELLANVTLRDFFPSGKAFQNSYYALHEYLGIIWYKILY